MTQTDPQAGPFAHLDTAGVTINAEACTSDVSITTAGYMVRVIGTGFPVKQAGVNAAEPGDLVVSTNGSAPPCSKLAVRGDGVRNNLASELTG